jgi:hypothetical protein
LLASKHESAKSIRTHCSMVGPYTRVANPIVPRGRDSSDRKLDTRICYIGASSKSSWKLSATVALQQLLRPLKWCHLIVARVPSALVADLLQYPAPFILGMPSEDPGMMDLIRDLPNDVTLVDLDVGRVILALSFAHNSEMGRGTPNNEDTARALRSQVLYLAQSLGGVFGARMDSPTWLCNQPLLTNYEQPAAAKQESEFDTLRSVCQSFLKELLAGTTSCCYWAEEGAHVISAGT